MPEILADLHPQPTKARIECLHRVAPGEITPLIEHGVGRQINFMVNVQNPAVRQNRLTLLHAMLSEFSGIADFSEIVTSSTTTSQEMK